MGLSTAIVTGATGGMGRAVVTQLSGQHNFILVDLDKVRLDELAGTLPNKATVVAGDIADPATIAAIAEKLGGDPLGPVVHTAGLSPTMADARRILEVNLVATAQLSAALLPFCQAGTVFVAISSMSGYLTNPSAYIAQLDNPLDAASIDQLVASIDPKVAYSLSKVGVHRLVQREAKIWGDKGGRIVSISPGLVRTKMGEAELENVPAMRQLMAMQPVPRFGTVEEIAAAVTFLISEQAAFITGVDLLVDGGAVALLRSNPAFTEGLSRLA